jgi:diguanylate cyclase (GGDEF)-like protein
MIKVNLRAKILLSTSAVISVMLVSTLIALNVSIKDAISMKVGEDLKASKLTAESVLRDRIESLYLSARLVVNSPRFGAEMAKSNINHQKVLFGLPEIQGLMVSDFMALTDTHGKVIAIGDGYLNLEEDISAWKSVSEALGGDEQAALRMIGDTLCQLVSLPVIYEGELRGSLIVGNALDHAFAYRIQPMIPSHIAFIVDNRIQAFSGGIQQRRELEDLIGHQPHDTQQATGTQKSSSPLSLTLANENHRAIISPLQSDDGSSISYVLYISVTRALAFYHDRVQILLVLIGLIAIILSFLVSFLLARLVSNPILQLANAAHRVSKGDLDQQVTIKSSDELGVLGRAFNQMVQDLKKIQDEVALAKGGLENKVKQRTRELDVANKKLQEWVKQLEQKNKEVTLLREMDDVFQACHTVDEMYKSVAKISERILPGWSGALSVMKSTTQPVEIVVEWGSPHSKGEYFMPNECIALRKGRMYMVKSIQAAGILCKHLIDPLPAGYICVPLIAQSKTLGTVHFYPPDSEPLNKEWQRFIGTVSRHIGLALANLNLREKLQHESIRDPLTGLFNRRYMEEALEIEIPRCARKQATLGVIMIDIDHFKKVNDQDGHEAGDIILCKVSEYLSENRRKGDVLCRHGGEEFVLIMPDANLEVTRRRAEELRKGFKNRDLMFGKGQHRPLTISIGVSVFPQHGTNGRSLIHAADMALYSAKEAGRDRVHIASTSEF